MWAGAGVPAVRPSRSEGSVRCIVRRAGSGVRSPAAHASWLQGARASAGAGPPCGRAEPVTHHGSGIKRILRKRWSRFGKGVERRD